nr:hypothetical protein [Tanacetum cinerariifolium]
MRPFGCPVTILNTKDHLGKFDGKADEGFFVRYSLNSKAFRVFNNRTRIVEENLHVRFSEYTPNIAGSGPNWLFDIEALTNSMNYKPVIAGNQSNGNAGTKACDDAGKARMETSSQDDGFQPSSANGKKGDEDTRQENECKDQEKEDNVNNTNNVNAAGTNEVNDEDDGAEANMNNLDTAIQNLENHGFVTTIHQITNHKDLQNCLFACFLSQEEPKNVIHVLQDPSWIEAMQEELLQFKLQEVWTLMDLPYGKRAIGTKWVFMNQKDKRGIVIRNKARIEAIRLFLAYTSFKDFVVYQMDVESAFLYEKLKEEVYVCQPLGFKDPNFPDKVYKVKKTLYGLHQAPRAWHKDDILLVQVYVYDIFGSTKKELCNTFEKIMHEKFQMSSMGELTFFLGLQVKQKQDGIFISQDKYVAEILKKDGFSEARNTSTPMETQKPLLKDEDGEEVDVHIYMIGSLMYLTSSRLDIMFAVCACARYQVTPKVSHIYVVKRIFRYLKGHPKLGLWYPKYSSFDLVAYIDSDYAGASLDRKSTTGGFASLVDGKKVIITKSTIRKDLQLEDAEAVDCLPNAAIFEQLTLMGRTKRKDTKVPQLSVPTSVTDDAINEEMDDSLEKAATTATSLDAEQDKGDAAAHTRSKRLSKVSNDPLLAGVNTPQSEEDSLKLTELMKLYTNLQQRVLDLETTKTTQALKIYGLKRRVKKLEWRKKSRNHRLKRLYKLGLLARVESSTDECLGEDDASKQGRIADIDANEDITLVSTHDEQMFDVDQDLATLAQALAKLKHEKTTAKAKGIVFHKLEESTTTTIAEIPKSKLQDKGKAKMNEEPMKLKKKDQIQLDEEVALKLHAKLQAEFDKKQRLTPDRAQQEVEANITLIESWDDVQAKINADY